VIYSPLLTDQYQLVMAYNYWKLGMAQREAVFHLSFRQLPEKCDYLVSAGLESVIEFLANFQFSSSDLSYLKKLQTHHAKLFSADFLDYLEQLTFTCDLHAIPEGVLSFAKEPILRIQGSILQCQLLETPLLNFIHFATLIATKASVLYSAAQSDPIIEFGLRRAHGPDGGLTASRSAFIGGCSGTSNALAGKLFDIPIQGTQAHSWIMAFPTELEAFRSVAQVMGNATILLVDTYKTVDGIKHAIEIGHSLQKEGHELAGIRLDSGDLLALSKEARRMLDEANLPHTKIIASGDLDEDIIRYLKSQHAPIDSWGVGTRLVTSYTQPALNAIYKLAAIKNSEGNWDYKMKISDDPQKLTLPGIQQIRRYSNQRDIIYNIRSDETLPSGGSDLLQPIFCNGKLVYQTPTLHQMRETCIAQVQAFSEHAPKPYPVELGTQLRAIIAHTTQSHEH
jgi:nicotinate phosphoribosyltransferase